MKTAEKIGIMAFIVAVFLGVHFWDVQAQSETPSAPPPAGDSISKPFEEVGGAFRKFLSITEKININPLNLPFADKIAAAIPRSTDEAVELVRRIGEAGKSAAKPLDSFADAYTYPVLDLFVKAAVFVLDRLGNLFRYVFGV